MSFLPEITSITNALGWAVLHSIWQGGIAVAAVWIFRALTREQAADVRYMFSFVTLTALLAAFVGTFLTYFNPATTAGLTGNPLIIPVGSANLDAASLGAASPLAALTNSTHIIGAAWAVCFAILGARYLAAFRLTHNLRTKGISDIPSEWQTKFALLLSKAGVSGKTRAYISDRVSSPVTFGYFKPVVLVPAWFFTGMSAEQCEAVILHELAHIRRHDYLANILQIVIKTVFFYHPAVQYISKKIDTDREHACDDIAVALTKSPETLAYALGAIRIKAAKSGGVFALAADGNEAPLMNRLKRLMGTQSRRVKNGTAKGTAASVMLLAALGFTLTIGAGQSVAHPVKTADDENWQDRLAGAPVSTHKAGDYTYGEHKYKGKIYTVKTDGQQKFINIDGNWYETKRFPEMNIKLPKHKGTPRASLTNGVYIDGKKIDTSTPEGQRVLARAERSRDKADQDLRSVLNPDGRNSQLTINGKRYNIKTNNDGDTFVKVENDWVDFADIDDWSKFGSSGMAPVAAVSPVAPIAPAAPTHNWDHIDHDQGGETEEAYRDLAQHQRELAQEQAELAREMKQEQIEHAREMAHASAERSRERSREHAERQREQAEHAREMAAVQREIASEQRRNASEQRKDAQKAQKMAELHRKDADKQRYKYEEMRDRLIPQLKKDGFMTSDNTKVTLRLTETDIFINDKQLNQAQENSYCEIVSDYMKRKGDVKKIILKKGFLHVHSKGENGHSTYTYNQ